MFERFTDRARKVIKLAHDEAERLSHNEVRPEHVMLGMAKEGSGVAANVLRNLNCDLRKLREQVESRFPEEEPKKEIPQSSQTKKIIEKAIIAARELGHNYVGTEHFLLGLSQLSDTLVQEILKDLNVTTENIRDNVYNILGIGQTVIDHNDVDQNWKKPTWDEYFMFEATTALSRSPDPCTKHGAVIVNERKRPVGQGYNGFPSGGDENIYPLTRPEKYVFVIHAEANAILNCTFPPLGCTLYVTGVPCNNCMKYVIQAGIKRVVYGKIGSNMVDGDELQRTMLMAKNHNIEIHQYNEKVSPYEWHLRIAGYLKEKGWS